MAWVAKAHNAHPVPTPCYVQGHQPADQAAQSHIQPGLECLQGWGIHNLNRTSETSFEDTVKLKRAALFVTWCVGLQVSGDSAAAGKGGGPRQCPVGPWPMPAMDSMAQRALQNTREVSNKNAFDKMNCH